ncbi:hypothetical protein CLAIMM_01402 [Cladophialophora immunda]|nr:hypothetical protein CLAIMM_01402 [Cladophialophora immunda]
MCKIIKYRYTKCYKPADAGEDYDEHDPRFLCDGGVEIAKIPCFVEVCDKHEDGIPRHHFPFRGYVNEMPKCQQTVEFCYLPTYCASHREHLQQNGQPIPPDDANIHTEPERPLGDFVWHIPSIPWKDPGFRMVDWNPEPRRVPLDRPENSPKTRSTFDHEEGGVINAFYDAEHWVSADGRPIDLLENHYDDPDINDRPAFPRMKGPAMPPQGSMPPQDGQNPGPQSTQPELEPANSQVQSQVNPSQGQSQYNITPRAQQTLGPAIGDAQPAAPPSRPMFGTWREASKSRLSSEASSSSSDSSASEPSPGRPKITLKLRMNQLQKPKEGDQPGTRSPAQSSSRTTTTAGNGTGSPEPSRPPTKEDDIYLSEMLSGAPLSSTLPSSVQARPASPSSTQTLVQTEEPLSSRPQGPPSPQGRTSPDGEEGEEQGPPKRRKLNSGRAATTVAQPHHMRLRSRGTRAATVGAPGTRTATNTHGMRLRPRAPRPPPAPAPAPAPAQTNNPAARTGRGRTRTAGRAGTRGAKGTSNAKGKAKSTTQKTQPRHSNKAQKKTKKPKTQTQTRTQRQPRRQAALNQAGPSTTQAPAPSTSGLGPMTRARRVAQGAQLANGLN